MINKIIVDKERNIFLVIEKDKCNCNKGTWEIDIRDSLKNDTLLITTGIICLKCNFIKWIKIQPTIN